MNSFIVVLVLSAVVAVSAGNTTCDAKWDKLSGNDFMKVSNECYKKLGVKQEDLDKKSEEDYIKSGYDDKCFGKCLLEGMKFLNNNTFNREAIKNGMKKDAHKNIQDKVVEIALKCVDATEKLVQAQPGLKISDCKSSAYVLFCYQKEFAKVTC